MNKNASLKWSQRCAIASNIQGILLGLGFAGKHWIVFPLSFIAMFYSFHCDNRMQEELFGKNDEAQ